MADGGEVRSRPSCTTHLSSLTSLSRRPCAATSGQPACSPRTNEWQRWALGNPSMCKRSQLPRIGRHKVSDCSIIWPRSRLRRGADSELAERVDTGRLRGGELQSRDADRHRSYSEVRSTLQEGRSHSCTRSDRDAPCPTVVSYVTALSQLNETRVVSTNATLHSLSPARPITRQCCRNAAPTVIVNPITVHRENHACCSAQQLNKMRPPALQSVRCLLSSEQPHKWIARY